MSDCTGGLTLCGGACVDVQSSASHCGMCDMACPPGQACVAGRCGGAAACSGAEVSCGGRCVNTRFDPAHCGGCGRACAAGQVCMSGLCEMCMPGQMACPAAPGMGVGSTCVNTQVDIQHCGGCGRACPATSTGCVMGICR
jgi:hypothetical protein